MRSNSSEVQRGYLDSAARVPLLACDGRDSLPVGRVLKTRSRKVRLTRTA